MPTPPAKLKHDAIVEAILEIQFEHAETPEVVVGSLASSAQWKGYSHSRLPVAELPAGLREADPDLRFQPIIQLNRPLPGEVLKVGPRVLSLHVLRPYPGWATFLPRLQGAISAVFEAVAAPVIHRVGLRYVNALTPAHGFNDLGDLNFSFSVGDEHALMKDLLIAYNLDVGPNARVQVKVASPIFVAGPVVPGPVAYVDVDVATTGPMGLADSKALGAWVVEAHKAEKDAFFKLWPENTLEAMAEE